MWPPTQDEFDRLVIEWDKKYAHITWVCDHCDSGMSSPIYLGMDDDGRCVICGSRDIYKPNDQDKVRLELRGW